MISAQKIRRNGAAGNKIRPDIYRGGQRKVPAGNLSRGKKEEAEKPGKTLKQFNSKLLF